MNCCCCNLMRNPPAVIPVIVSSSLAARSLLRNHSSPSCGGFHRFSKANRNRVCSPTYLPTLGSIQDKIGILRYKNNYSHTGARVSRFSSSTVSTQTSWENGRGREKDSTTLPWITATGTAREERPQGRKVGRENKTAQTGTNHSSWEISAERYFSRNNTNSPPKIVTEEESRNTSLVEDKRNSSNGKLDGKRKEPPHSHSHSHSRKGIIDNRREQQHSSSERSYFSRNGSSSKLSKEPTRGNRYARVVNQEEFRRNTVGAKEAVEVEMKDDESRWDGIKKSNYRGGFIDRESRFEKQPEEVRHWNMQENWGKKTWKEATESSLLPKMVGQGVYGVGPVLAALTMERREFYALYIQQGLELGENNRKKKDKKGVEKVFKLAEKMGLKVIESSKHDLNMVVDNRPHQGLVLDASPLELVNIKELEPPFSPEGQKAPLWIALDEVMDPQNLGAIVRSSYFFGVEGVILCAKNSAPLSGVVSKASAGSLELIELRSCKNMMQFLSSSTENGWRVLGGSVSSRALPLSTVEAGMPTILVLGSEGTGLRPLVERSCTQLIRIPGNMSISACAGEIELETEMVAVDQTHSGVPELKSSFLAVESLNVSVAAGVLLYHLVGSNSHLPDTKPGITYE